MFGQVWTCMYVCIRAAVWHMWALLNDAWMGMSGVQGTWDEPISAHLCSAWIQSAAGSGEIWTWNDGQSQLYTFFSNLVQDRIDVTPGTWSSSSLPIHHLRSPWYTNGQIGRKRWLVWQWMSIWVSQSMRWMAKTARGVKCPVTLMTEKKWTMTEWKCLFCCCKCCIDLFLTQSQLFTYNWMNKHCVKYINFCWCQKI